MMRWMLTAAMAMLWTTAATAGDYAVVVSRKTSEDAGWKKVVDTLATNCLMGHVDGPEAMALAWMKSAGVCQMAGYTVPTWYGYAGWGWLDYFVEEPGRYTLAEAYYANQQALIHRLHTYFPELAQEEPAPGQTVPAGVKLRAK